MELGGECIFRALSSNPSPFERPSMSTQLRSRVPWRARVAAAPCFAAAALALLAAGACTTCTPRDLSLRDRPDFASPAIAFESFRAAVRCDDPTAAYRCLSEAMKERDEITVTKVLIWWEGTFKRNPFARLAGNAEIETIVYVDDRRSIVIATAYGQRRAVEFVRQEFFDVRVRGRAAPVDDYVQSLAGMLRVDGDALVARVRDPKLQGVEPRDVVSATFGTEWKILRFSDAPPPESQPSAQTPTSDSTSFPTSP